MASLEKFFDGVSDGPNFNDAILFYAVEMSIIGDQDSSGMQTSCRMDHICCGSCRKIRFAPKNILIRLLNDYYPISNEFKKTECFKFEGIPFIF